MKKARLVLSTAALSIFGLASLTLTSCGDKEETCLVGYEGKDCKTLSREKFLGSWTGSEKCTEGKDNYTIVLAASGSNEIAMTYSNVYNQNFSGIATMTGQNSFNFKGSAANGVEFSGKGNLAAGELSVNYDISDNTGLDNTCTFTGTKD